MRVCTTSTKEKEIHKQIQINKYVVVRIYLLLLLERLREASGVAAIIIKLLKQRMPRRLLDPGVKMAK